MKMEKTESPHIGSMLQAYAKQKRTYKGAWARHQQVRRSTVSGYFKKPTMQTATLWDICHVLQYNFFADISALLPPEFAHAPNTADEKIALLEKEIEKLKIENNVLREVRG
ncbi:MAG: hypothetical protein ACKVPJ_00850 [Chitinophagales bacterium]